MKTVPWKVIFAFAIATATLAAVPARSDVVGSTFYKGKTNWVDVIPNGSQADVWFRVQRYACSKGDFHVARISRSTVHVKKNVTVKSVAATICTVKQVYDNSKTIAGCAATVGSGVCLAASAPTGELTAVLCSVSIDYALDKGAKDCLLGVSNLVARWVAKERNWAAFATGYKIGTQQWGDAIDHAIDLACTFVK